MKVRQPANNGATYRPEEGIATEKQRLTKLVLIGFIVAASAALAWRFTPLADYVQPENIAQRLEAIEKYRWSPFAFVAAYVLGGLLMVPVTFLSAAAAIVFVPIKAVAVSFTGTLLSAALLHWIGARFLRGRARQSLGRTIERVDHALSDRGIVTIAAVRMIPLAPFTLVNIAAGSIGVRFRDYMLGTALGLAPGITIVCVFGRQVRELWQHPSLAAVLVVVGVVVVWIAMSLALQRWVSRRTKRRAQA